jgi:hypothetical protein
VERTTVGIVSRLVEADRERAADREPTADVRAVTRGRLRDVRREVVGPVSVRDRGADEHTVRVVEPERDAGDRELTRVLDAVLVRVVPDAVADLDGREVAERLDVRHAVRLEEPADRVRVPGVAIPREVDDTAPRVRERRGVATGRVPQVARATGVERLARTVAVVGVEGGHDDVGEAGDLLEHPDRDLVVEAPVLVARVVLGAVRRIHRLRAARPSLERVVRGRVAGAGPADPVDVTGRDRGILRLRADRGLGPVRRELIAVAVAEPEDHRPVRIERDVGQHRDRTDPEDLGPRQPLVRVRVRPGVPLACCLRPGARRAVGAASGEAAERLRTEERAPRARAEVVAPDGEGDVLIERRVRVVVRHVRREVT